jgi:ABC-2 type transport system permease protein
MYPEALFGGVLRMILFSVLPAGFISYVPVRVIRDGSLIALPVMLLAAVGFLALGIIVFQRGVRRYASGSRFGVWG